GIGLGIGRLARVFERIGGLDGLGDGGEVGVALLDGIADQFALRRGAGFHDADERQRGLALAQVVADVLAQRVGVAAVVEHVVDQLEAGADVPAIGGGGLLLG